MTKFELITKIIEQNILADRTAKKKGVRQYAVTVLQSVL